MNLDNLFRQILKPALGCTEPVAIALATSAAVQASAGWTPHSAQIPFELKPAEVRALHLRVSRNIFKNAFAILIPNAEGRKGLVMSAALGAFCDPRAGMALFHGLDSHRLDTADEIAKSRRVHVSIADDAPSDLYIEAEVQMHAASGSCVIKDEHAKFACLKRNGNLIFGSAEFGGNEDQYSEEIRGLREMSIAEIVALVDALPESVLAILRETVERNVSACKAGLLRPMGIGAGYFGSSAESTPVSFSQYVSGLTAAGSDARMAGYAVEIMTSAGSGNQGIAATIPVVAYSRLHFVDDERMLRAVGLAHLVTMYITSYVGYLSALCGVAIKAGIGAACGTTYAMGGESADVERAIKIMAATLTGMICDGAKIGCALKVSSAAEMATRAAILAMRKAEVPDDNGIVAPTAEGTIQNLAELSRSMHAVDQKIVEIMLAKIAH